MTPKELQKWMDKNNKSAVEVAAQTHVSEATVKRFLQGKTEPVPLVLDAFKRLVEQKTA